MLRLSSAEHHFINYEKRLKTCDDQTDESENVLIDMILRTLARHLAIETLKEKDEGE